ncbi:MAG TPA: protein kinase [Frankiaceae bacterium]|nr:protein kinase [Frankiaceae bacterium]
MLDPLQPADPSRVGRYDLTARLGAGGMGVVYRAEGRRGVVALKLVRPELAQDATFRARFRREIQSCFRVSSAFTARLVDFDTEAESPWMATEFVEGEPLDQLVERRGPLGPEAQVGLAAGLAESLVAIHAEDVVHRDLKPANVMCTDSGPKVIDFGIATAMDALPMTQAGMVIGSPGWITPEQLMTGEATPASDVFAWGCLMAYAASGVQPYGTGQMQTIFWRVLNQPPYVDRERVSPVLCELIDAAVAYDPAQRPDSAGLLDRLLSAARPIRRQHISPAPEPAPQEAPQLAGSVVDEKWVLGATVLDAAPLPVSLLRTDDSGHPADAVELVKGANTELETAPLLVDLMWSAADGADLQVAALLIGDDGRSHGTQPIIDRQRPQAPESLVHHVGHDRTERGWRDRLLVDLPSAPNPLSRVLVTAALDDAAPAGLTFGAVARLEVVLGAPRAGGRPVRFVVPPLGTERAIVAVEIYRRGGRWRVRAVAQGYAEGALGLARDFGADLAAVPRPRQPMPGIQGM